MQVSLVVSAGGGSSLHLPSSINQINMRLRDNNKDSFLEHIDQVAQSIEQELEAKKKVVHNLHIFAKSGELSCRCLSTARLAYPGLLQ